MKTLKYILFSAMAFAMLSCGDDFLEQKNLYEKLDDTYYKTPTDISEALTGAYSRLPTDAGYNDPILLDNLMSDDCFAGGGTNDVGFFNIDAFLNTSENAYKTLWVNNYEGIFRTNMLIKKFNQAVYKDENQRLQDLGEAHFLRAYFYFSMARFFGTVPLVIDPGPVNFPKATADELFAQIASDMKIAIESMPAINYSSISTSRLGHATKWAAEGMMARIFLFYTGYYNKTEMPLVEGGFIAKEQVIGWVDDCIANSGHKLLPKFGNLWPYSAAETYAYAANNGLVWAGEEGANTETVFAIKYSPYANWSAPDKLSYSNQLALYNGLRAQTNTFPFGVGWGAGPVNPQILSTFEAGDQRLKASIIDVTDPEEGNLTTKFKWGADKMQQETGYWQKKYQPIMIEVTNASGKIDLKNLYNVMLGTNLDYQRYNMQDEVLLRFADIMLMGAELGSANAQQYLDKVRERAGLGSVSVTLENIKLERRHELAFEGLRYLDLLRWHDVEKAMATANNIPVKTVGEDDTYTVNYRKETGGFLPIPESEISLQAGVLTQNPGW